jgi:hypothetical protein
MPGLFCVEFPAGRSIGLRQELCPSWNIRSRLISARVEIVSGAHKMISAPVFSWISDRVMNRVPFGSDRTLDTAAESH